VHYERTGDVALLDEAIELKHEALASRPLGHPDRADSCVNLATSLHMRYKQTGNVVLLDEAIELEREALALQPLGHPDRANSSANLAASLHVRYTRTGDVGLLDQAIALEREVLALQALGHPDRASGCVSLASSLHMGYEQGGNVALLDEAIELNYEALTLRPPGHPDRAKGCASLGASLYVRYQRTGNVVLLDEVIKFNREALTLRPPGHPSRAYSYVSLGVLLHERYQQTSNVALLNEAVETYNYASGHLSAYRVWYPLTLLSELHLLRNSPHYSVLTALQYLQRSFQHEVDNIHSFISSVCWSIILIWDNSRDWNSHTIGLLAAIYAQVVDRLPLMAGFVLDTSSRLKTLKSTCQVGSDACVAALLAEQPATAVELLDRAHGVVWTQALHQRDPQMEGAPKDMAIELENLLREISTSTPVDPARLLDRLQDLRHRQNTRIQVLLRDIRAMPGLARFMLGSTYETLREAARDNPVVVLVAGPGHAFAVIMPSCEANANPDLLPLDVAWKDLRSLADMAGKGNIRYRAGSTEDQRAEAPAHAELTDQERAMRAGNFASQWSPLASLWRDVVKPVLSRLHLMVSHPEIVPTHC
jgi:tetratricopeptide (TPR) repeat protein